MSEDSNTPSGEAEIEIDPALFRSVMGHYPTGVTVVASLEGEAPIGLAIGSLFSVSLAPPLIGFCVAKTSSSWERIEATGVFGVTVLSENQKDTSGRFASKLEDKFAGDTWVPAPVTGSPLIVGGVAHLDCKLHSVLEGGDHVIVLGRVQYLDIHRADLGPLLFFRGGYGRHDPIEPDLV
ncbi:MAG: flavin reductase family protein [Microthrixaceae bacterium]